MTITHGEDDRGNTIRKGFSDSTDAEEAAEAFFQQVWQPDMELTVFFCSPDYDLDALGKALAERFGDAPLVGCTTAGEITPEGYRHGTLTGFSLAAPDFRVAMRTIPKLKQFGLTDGYNAACEARDELNERGYTTDGDNSFGFLLIDPMSAKEEYVAHALNAALEDIQLFGGSAGDGVSMNNNPFVYHDGAFRKSCAVFMLLTTTRPFSLIKTGNYVPTDTKMVVTGAEPGWRQVTEINGESAGVEYASLIGVAPEKLNTRLWAGNPLGLVQGDDFHIRAISSIDKDGTMNFSCAIDEGVVLSLARSGDYLGRLGDALESARGVVGEPDLLIACDCLYRLYENYQLGIRDEVSELMQANNAVGLNTYGEQFNAMHVNQTLTGVAIGRGDGRRDG